MLSIFPYLVFEVPFIRISKRIFTEDEKSISSCDTIVMKTANELAAKLENLEVNGNGINGIKSRTDEEKANTRL